MTIYTIIQNACIEAKSAPPDIGVASPSASDEVLEMMRCAYRVAYQLRHRFEWNALLKLGSIVLVDGQAEYDMPSDYDGLAPSTAYDNQNKMFLFGPVTPEKWMELKYSPLNSSVFPRKYRMTGWSGANKMSIHPVPTSADAGQIIYFQYTSKNWIYGADGTYKSTFSNDQDTICWDEEMFTMGVASEFMAMNKIDATRQLQLFNSMKQIEFAKQRTANNIIWDYNSDSTNLYLNYPRNIG